MHLESRHLDWLLSALPQDLSGVLWHLSTLPEATVARVGKPSHTMAVRLNKQQYLHEVEIYCCGNTGPQSQVMHKWETHQETGLQKQRPERKNLDAGKHNTLK